MPRRRLRPMSRDSDGAPLPRVSPARGVQGAIRLLVLIRLLLAVLGLGRLLRKAALGLRVRLAGLVLRGFVHAARLPDTDANSPVRGGVMGRAPPPRPRHALALGSQPQKGAMRPDGSRRAMDDQRQRGEQRTERSRAAASRQEQRRGANGRRYRDGRFGAVSECSMSRRSLTAGERHCRRR